jgi:hypothetical protein
MAYQDNEVSVQDGQPIECYKFTGSFNNYFYTSYGKQVTIAGDIYTPKAIKRNNATVGTQDNSDNALEITLPFNDNLVKEYLYQESPPSLGIEIFRAHATDLTDYKLLWVGQITSISVSENIATLLAPTFFSILLSGSSPVTRYQAPCNHVLYDGRCGVDPATNQQSATIMSISNNVVEVDTYTLGS